MTYIPCARSVIFWLQTSSDNLPESVVEMPRNSKVIYAATQNGSMFVWAIVDPEDDIWEFKFFCVMTGADFGDIGEKARHLQTVQLRDNTLVCHVFMDRRIITEDR